MLTTAGMERVSLRLSEETLGEVEEREEESGASRSEILRDLVESALADERGQDVDERLRSVREDYEEQIKELERENERLNRERRQILEQREEHTELVSAVKSEQTLSERKAKAGVGTRLKWWMFGMSDGE